MRVKSKREIERRGRDLEGERERERRSETERDAERWRERETRSSGGSTPEKQRPFLHGSLEDAISGEDRGVFSAGQGWAFR